MSNTIQLRSLPMPEETGENISVIKEETEYDIRSLLSIYQGLINLSKSLTKMDLVQNKLFDKLNALENIIHDL